MQAIDTNVLVRALVQDDPAQSAQASAVFRSGEPILIPTTVLLESEWVLRRLYKKSFSEIAVESGLPKIIWILPTHCTWRLARSRDVFSPSIRNFPSGPRDAGCAPSNIPERPHLKGFA